MGNYTKERQREYAKQHYLKNRELYLARAKQRAVEKKEEISEYQKSYASENKAQRKAYLKAYHHKFAHVLAEKARDAYRADPAKFAIRTRARNSQVATATVMWDKELDHLVFSEAKKLCKLRQESTGVKWEVDHIVPILSPVVCGLHCFSNISVIPRTRNREKGNRFWPSMAGGN